MLIEELTEEGLPFLILFVDPNDKESLAKYKNAVKSQLLHERSELCFLFAPVYYRADLDFLLQTM